MDEKSKYRKQGYEINPKNHFGTIFTFILGLLAYYQFSRTLNLNSNIILFLTVVTIICIYFIVVFLFRLKTMVREHNELFVEYKRIQDNRDTLKRLVENKNKEIDNLNDACSTMKAQAQMLLHFAYYDEKPSKEIVMKSLSIERKEVDNNE